MFKRKQEFKINANINYKHWDIIHGKSSTESLLIIAEG